jgi:hypothetical protein
MKIHTITAEEYAEVRAAMKANKNKRADQCLQVIALRRKKGPGNC